MTQCWWSWSRSRWQWFRRFQWRCLKSELRWHRYRPRSGSCSKTARSRRTSGCRQESQCPGGKKKHSCLCRRPGCHWGRVPCSTWQCSRCPLSHLNCGCRLVCRHATQLLRRFLHCFAHSTSGVVVVVEGSAVVVSATARAKTAERARTENFMLDIDIEKLLDQRKIRY